MTDWVCNQIVRDEGFGQMECGEPAEYKTRDGQPRCFFHTPKSGYFDRRGATDERNEEDEDA